MSNMFHREIVCGMMSNGEYDTVRCHGDVGGEGGDAETLRAATSEAHEECRMRKSGERYEERTPKCQRMDIATHDASCANPTWSFPKSNTE